DQAVAAVDADDAAPGAGADHRADAEGLDRRVDDVPVGAGELVGDGDHGAARRVPRVGLGPYAAGHVPADDPPGQLLHHQLGGVSAAVLPHVHDQALAGHLDAQVAVDLRPAGGLHVGDVDVAEAAAGLLVHVGPPVGDPGVVAQWFLVGDGDDDGVPGFAAAGRGDGQLDRLARGAHQQRGGPGDGVDGLPGDGDDRVAGADGHAGRGERGAGVRVGGLRGQDPVDAPAAVLVTGEVRAEQALPGAVAVPAARGDVGVRGAEFALHLPQQVHQVVVGGEPGEDGAVAVQDGVPVDAVELRVPEVVAHDAARLVEHLPPLGGGVY